jgi:UDP-N-acetylmuramoyl-tripeptide--D-alanyl-D-alanine ligase
VRDVSATRTAELAAARLTAGDPGPPGPGRAVVDSRAVASGDLFVGLSGTQADGGEFAPEAIEAGAWGVLVSEDRAERLATTVPSDARVLAARDPLEALQTLARHWRRELGSHAIGVTGSTGKTSTKDILAALLTPHLRTHASRENFNTEIGLPLTVLEAERGTQVLVLEMAMRGEGQIAELAAIARPSVGVIVNVGPVHLELLETVERVAAAKAELIRDLEPGASCVVPAGEPLLEAHLRDDLDTVTFGEGGDVTLRSFDGRHAEIDARGQHVRLELPFDQAYNVQNTLAAVAAATCVGVVPAGEVDVSFSSLRGEVVELAGGVTVVNDCYNANPMSMRAALEHLAETPAERRIAVLGGMGELGDHEASFHREIGAHADALGIDVLVTVGGLALGYSEEFGGESHSVGTPEEAAAILEEIAAPGDRVLVKGSRSVGLERVLA